MRLWTIQHENVWHTLRREGVFRADGRRVEPYFRPAYRWLIEQMEMRIPGYRKGRYPVWAWHQPKPDMRRDRWHYLADGERGFKIELEVPNHLVLLSDFEAWHMILNRDLLPLHDAEHEEYHERYVARLREWKAEGRPAGGAPKEHYQELIRSTWPRVFDLETLAQSECWGCEEPEIQATFEEIRLDYVQKVTPFRAAKRKFWI